MRVPENYEETWHSSLKIYQVIIYVQLEYPRRVLRYFYTLTHWRRVRHICINKLNIIGSNNGLPPGWRQAIIWTNAGILSIGPLGTNFDEILVKIHTFSFKKMHLKMPSGKWQPFCLGLNVLRQGDAYIHQWTEYRKVSNIRRTKYQDLNASRLIL